MKIYKGDKYESEKTGEVYTVFSFGAVSVNLMDDNRVVTPVIVDFYNELPGFKKRPSQ